MTTKLFNNILNITYLINWGTKKQVQQKRNQ